jgi:16S rRNA (guanine527-N7)-methyltransferase
MQIGSKEWSDLVIEGAAALDIDLDTGQTRQFAVHAAELVRWNRKINLTAITDPFEIAVKHFLDSLPAARSIPGAASVLDLGSGGGFPGLPLKVLKPCLSITLIDASRKKVSFLKHVIRTLKLDHIEALHIRAEDLAEDPRYRNRFHVIISRAFSSLEFFHRLALPLLIEGGTILALKGSDDVDGIRTLQGSRCCEGDDPKTAGPHFSVTVEKFRLPFINSNRSIAIIRKLK